MYILIFKVSEGSITKEMKKIRNFLSKLGLFGFLFIVILFSFGIVNGYRAMKFWINDETYNNQWTMDLGSKGETEYISNFWGKNNFFNLNGFMRNLTGQREMNGIVKLNNGYCFTPFGYISDEELEQRALALADLNRFLSASGTELLVAIAPDTINKYDPQVPMGTEEYVNDNLDRLVSMLEEQGLEVMDFRELIHEDGIDQYTMMYKTDHHWTTKAGFYAYGKIADWIEEKTGVGAEEKIRNIENYSVTTYENWHLGSRGQRTGPLFAGIDDFDLILPEFDTRLTNGEKTGSFEELFINLDSFAEEDITLRSTYDMTMRQSCGDFTNLNAVNDLKIFWIGDSFSEAVCPYINISYQEVQYLYCLYSIDLTEDYLETYDPDVVICLYSPENIFDANGVAFNFPVEGNQ